MTNSYHFLTTDPTIRQVNAAMLIICGFVCLVLISSFRKFMIRRETSRIFFVQILLATCTMFAFALSFLYPAQPRNIIFSLFTAIAFLGIFMIQYLYIRYLISVINMRRDQSVHPIVHSVALIVCVISAILWILTIFSQDFGALSSRVPYFGSLFWIGNIGEWILVIISIVLLYKHRTLLSRGEILVLLSLPVLMVLATLLEPFTGGLELRYPAFTIEILLLYAQHYLDLETSAQRVEMETMHNRLALAAGHMKPHYMYNVLTTIYYLCDVDPEKAQEAIGSFAEYLRNTLEAIDNEELVPFSWELSQIRYYLSLEKIRYEDRLNIVYDVDVNEFLVPPLSIQPFVENAVKHGIAGRESGGTVSIITRKLADGGVQIRIVDDGVGFDVSTIKEQKITQEGVANARERLRLECGADMTITSSPGKGTTVMITLRPQKP